VKNRILDHWSLILSLTFVSGMIILQISYPLITPVTDDWIFYPWQIRQVSPGKYSDLELFIGQQQILVKYILYLTSYLPFLEAPRTGLVNIAFGATGIILLIRSQFIFLSKKANFPLVTAVVIVSFSFKPLYMYFMATSLGSMLALFLIGLYFMIKNSQAPRSWRLLPILFLSPFTFGAGLIIVICELIEIIYLVCRKREFTEKIKTFTFVSLISLSIFVSQILPDITQNYNELVGGAPAPVGRGAIELFLDPINSMKFLVISAGNIFVPSSRFDPIAPFVAGCFFLFACIYFLRKTPNKDIFDGVLLNKSCLLAGAIFILLTLISRGAASQQGFTAAIAPRYLLGSFIFTMGVLIIISKVIDDRKRHLRLNIFLLVLALSVLVSGVKTGSEWLSVRRAQTTVLSQCLDSSSEADLVAGGKCFLLGEVVRNPVSDQIFSEQLRNFKSNGY